MAFAHLASLREADAAHDRRMAATSAYGCCPQCGLPGKQRERRPNGNDICEAGHKYPSKSAVACVMPKRPVPPPARLVANGHGFQLFDWLAKLIGRPNPSLIRDKPADWKPPV